jgi:uncharacterized membrane protein YcfT
MPNWPTTTAYVVKSIALWVGFLLAIFLSTMGRANSWPAAVLILLAVIPALTVAFQFKLAWQTIADQDEFVRALAAKRLMIAAAFTIGLSVFWGSLQLSLGFPTLPIWLVYPLFWGIFGVISAFIPDSHA